MLDTAMLPGHPSSAHLWLSLLYSLSSTLHIPFCCVIASACASSNSCSYGVPLCISVLAHPSLTISTLMFFPFAVTNLTFLPYMSSVVPSSVIFAFISLLWSSYAALS